MAWGSSPPESIRGAAWPPLGTPIPHPPPSTCYSVLPSSFQRAAGRCWRPSPRRPHPNGAALHKASPPLSSVGCMTCEGNRGLLPGSSFIKELPGERQDPHPCNPPPKKIRKSMPLVLIIFRGGGGGILSL